MTQDVYFSNHSFIFPPASLDALKSYRRALRKTPTEVLLSLGTMAIRDRHDGLLNFDDMCQALHWLRPFQVKAVCQDLIGRGALLRLTEEVVWIVGFNEKNYSRSRCVERARRVNSQPRLSRMPPEKLQAIAANTHLGLGIPQDSFAYNLGSKQGAAAPLQPAAPLKEKEKKTNVCLSQANSQRPPPLTRSVAQATAEAFEATLGAPAPRVEELDPKRAIMDPMAGIDPDVAHLMARADAIGEAMRTEQASAPAVSQAPKVPRPPRLSPTPRNPYPKPQPKPKPKVHPKGSPSAFVAYPGASPLPMPLTLHEVEVGLRRLGVDPLPGSRDEPERMFSQLMMAQITLALWQHGVWAVEHARGDGTVVANPTAYAWGAICKKRKQAADGAKPTGRLVAAAKAAQALAPNRPMLPQPKPPPPTASRPNPEDMHTLAGKEFLAQALAMVGIKNIPGATGARP
jgi:hypothetical protein